MQQPLTDFTKLDDPQFLEERRLVREELERLPEHHEDRAPLAVRYEAMTQEFVRRAASAWGAGDRREEEAPEMDVPQGNGTGTATADPILEESIRLHTTHRQDMVLWLALEVLMTDDMALADAELQDRLILLQDRLEQKLRAAVAA